MTNLPQMTFLYGLKNCLKQRSCVACFHVYVRDTEGALFFKSVLFSKCCSLCWFILKESITKTSAILNVTDCPKFTMRIIMTIFSTCREQQKQEKRFFSFETLPHPCGN